MPERRPVALDHNFPEPILRVLDRHLKEVELVWVRDIDEQLPHLDDDELIHALADHGQRVLVTGHDPLIATGVLLRDLLPALRKISARGQVFRTRPSSPRPTRAFDLLVNHANRRGIEPQELIDQHRPRRN